MTKVIRTVKLVADLLAQKDYLKIVQLGLAGSRTEDEIEFGVNQYPCKLIPPPPEAFNELRVYKADQDREDGLLCSVDFPLWTVEEGRSDLFLLLSLYESEGDFYNFTLDDLDVP
jgi:hypothetical protein